MLLQYIFKICENIVCCHKSSWFFVLTTHQVTSRTRTLFLHNLQQEVAFGPSSCDLFVDFLKHMYILPLVSLPHSVFTFFMPSGWDGERRRP